MPLSLYHTLLEIEEVKKELDRAVRAARLKNTQKEMNTALFYRNRLDALSVRANKCGKRSIIIHVKAKLPDGNLDTMFTIDRQEIIEGSINNEDVALLLMWHFKIPIQSVGILEYTIIEPGKNNG